MKGIFAVSTTTVNKSRKPFAASLLVVIIWFAITGIFGPLFGKLNESLPENFAISVDAKEASEPLGKNEELLFSCTEESFPNKGPKTAVITNQIITTSREIAKGLRLFLTVEVDTAKWPFIDVRMGPIGKEASLPLGYGCATS